MRNSILAGFVLLLVAGCIDVKTDPSSNVDGPGDDVPGAPSLQVDAAAPVRYKLTYACPGPSPRTFAPEPCIMPANLAVANEVSVRRYAIAQDQPDVVFVVVYDVTDAGEPGQPTVSSQPRVRRTDDGGATWTKVALPPIDPTLGVGAVGHQSILAWLPANDGIHVLLQEDAPDPACMDCYSQAMRVVRLSSDGAWDRSVRVHATAPDGVDRPTGGYDAWNDTDGRIWFAWLAAGEWHFRGSLDNGTAWEDASTFGRADICPYAVGRLRSATHIMELCRTDGEDAHFGLVRTELATRIVREHRLVLDHADDSTLRTCYYYYDEVARIMGDRLDFLRYCGGTVLYLHGSMSGGRWALEKIPFEPFIHDVFANNFEREVLWEESGWLRIRGAIFDGAETWQAYGIFDPSTGEVLHKEVESGMTCPIFVSGCCALADTDTTGAYGPFLPRPGVEVLVFYDQCDRDGAQWIRLEEVSDTAGATDAAL